jgi:signal transduction histidine kinase
MELSAEAITLQRCINDLIGVLAFPGIWSGRTPAQMASSFLDGLMRVLPLDAAYIRLSAGAGGPLDCVRVASDSQADPAWFTALDDDPSLWPKNFGPLAIESLRLGLPPGRGVVAVGSRRSGFPFLTEKVLLNVAGNQLLIGLQEAQLRVDQERAAEKLDERVAQRTAELAAVQRELSQITRVRSLGVLTAAIAHEVNQPLSGIMTNAGTCLRMLSMEPPNIEGALDTVRRTLRDAKRASEVIMRLRTLYSGEEVQFEVMDLNEAARDVISLSAGELQRNRVVLRQDLAEQLPQVLGDRIQLQQVILNLLTNAQDAMRSVEERPRELLIRTEAVADGTVCLSVCDCGVGFSHQDVEKLFAPFYTTKGHGMGIGLSVSRSIIEAHQGRLWATPNDGQGATFAFSLRPLPAGATPAVG